MIKRREGRTISVKLLRMMLGILGVGLLFSYEPFVKTHNPRDQRMDAHVSKFSRF